MEKSEIVERRCTVDRFEIADRIEYAGRSLEGIDWVGEQLDGTDLPERAAVVIEELVQATLEHLSAIEQELYPADKFPDREPTIKLRPPILKIA